MLRGIEYGEFDHITYVTVTKDGPVVANILLDGILPDDVQTFATTKNPHGRDLNLPRIAKKAAAPSSETANGMWKMELTEPLMKKNIKKSVGTVENGVAKIIGNNTKRNWVRFNLDLPDPAGKKIRVSADVKAQLNRGKFQLAIRRIRADKTLSYDGPFVNASQDWSKVSAIVPLDKKTDSIQCYLLGLDMDDKSFVEVRNVVFEEVR
jgi:hypothetical protein